MWKEKGREWRSRGLWDVKEEGERRGRGEEEKRERRV